MRLIINMDGIHEGTKRLRIRTRFNRTTRDGRMQIQAQNALVDLYHQIVGVIREAVDPNITDFQDEGEKD